jgi:hypothetical protein
LQTYASSEVTLMQKESKTCFGIPEFMTDHPYQPYTDTTLEDLRMSRILGTWDFELGLLNIDVGPLDLMYPFLGCWTGLDWTELRLEVLDLFV